MIFTYSRLLVGLQFFIILLLLLTNGSILNHFISLLISCLGLLLGIYSLLHNKLGNFNITPDIKENSKLIKNGAYKYIRHPMYTSVFMVMLGVSIVNINITNTFLFSCLIFILYLKAKKEETLWNEKDEEYKEYKRKTKMFIPFIL